MIGPAGQTWETADHSVPYVIAVALARGSVWIDDFDADRINDPEIRALMPKIRVRASEEGNREWPAAQLFRITVTTQGSQKHMREIRFAKGHPNNPLTDQEVEAKFRRLAEPILGTAQTDSALSQLWRLEHLRSVGEIFALFQVEASRQVWRSVGAAMPPRQLPLLCSSSRNGIGFRTTPDVVQLKQIF